MKKKTSLKNRTYLDYTISFIKKLVTVMIVLHSWRPQCCSLKSICFNELPSQLRCTQDLVKWMPFRFCYSCLNCHKANNALQPHRYFMACFHIYLEGKPLAEISDAYILTRRSAESFCTSVWIALMDVLTAFRMKCARIENGTIWFI